MNNEIYKPLNDFIALERTVLNTHQTLLSWRNLHEKNVLTDETENDYVFDRLEKMHNGECNFLVDELTKLDISNTGVKTSDDLIPYWNSFLKKLVGNIKYYVSYFSKFKSEFDSYPIFLKNRSYFITDKLYEYFMEYVKRDTNDADFIQENEILGIRQ